MNNLSWLIYAAEVAERVQTTAGVMAVMLGIFGSACFILLWAAHIAENFGSRKVLSIFTAAFWSGWLVLIILASVLPSQRTIYMIAASEAGEAVVTSPDAKAMMDDLKAIIRKRLKEELGEVGI